MCTEYDPLTDDCVYCGISKSFYYINHKRQKDVIRSLEFSKDLNKYLLVDYDSFESIDRLIGPPLTRRHRFNIWIAKIKSRIKNAIPARIIRVFSLDPFYGLDLRISSPEQVLRFLDRLDKIEHTAWYRFKRWIYRNAMKKGIQDVGHQLSGLVVSRPSSSFVIRDLK